MAKLSMGEFLTVLRKGQGYTQEEIAEKLGVSAKTVSSWENGRTYPDIMILPLIADIYNITVDELVRGERSTREVTPSEAKQNEKSLLKIRKLKYAKYKEKRWIYTISSIACSLLSILGLYLMNFVATWTLLFAVLGFLGCIAFTCFIIINEKTYLRNEGILLDEDITESVYPLVLSIRMNTLTSIFLSFVSYFVYGLILIIINTFNPSAFNFSSVLGVDIKSPVLTIAIISLILGILDILAFLVLRLVNIKKYGNLEHKTNAKHNIILTIIIIICIPSFLFTIYILGETYDAIFGEIVLSYDASYVSLSYQEYKDKLATYTVNNDKLTNAGLNDGDTYVLNFPKSSKYEWSDGVYDCGNSFVYMKNVLIPKNNVGLYINYDNVSGIYDSHYEISTSLYHLYYDTTDRENIVYITDNIEIKMPNEMFNKKYSDKYGIYYVEFVEGTYYSGNHKIVVSTNENSVMIYNDLFYHKSGTDMIEDYIDLDANIYYITTTYVNENGEIDSETIPTLECEFALIDNMTEYNVLGYKVETSTIDGYIPVGLDKGKYGHCEVAYFYLSYFIYYISVAILVIEIISAVVVYLILSKKQKFNFEFNF